MKTTRIIISLVFLLLIVAACNSWGAKPTDDPDQPVSNEPGSSMPNQDADYSPQPGDALLTQDVAFVDSMNLAVMESYPPQILLQLTGSLPTPCNLLRIEVGQPDEDNNIRVGVYSVVDGNQICTTVLQPFEQGVGLGSYPTGTYQVYVNDTLAGEFTMP